MRISSSALALALVLAACGGSSTPSSIESKLRQHLTERDLSVKWVRCVATSEALYRCNVNFGDPHIQVYCAALGDAALRVAEWRLKRRPSPADCARRLRS